MNSKELLLALFFIMFILFIGCTQQSITESKINKTVEFGDRVFVDYVLKANITDYTNNVTKEAIIDTSLENVAKQSSIFNEKRKYGALLVRMENNNGLLPGFTRAIVGMKEGQNKTFSLKPEDGYGTYNKTKIFSLKKLYNLSRYESIMIEYFKMNNISYELGTNLSSKYLNARVINITNTSVLLKYLPEENKSFIFNGLNQTVVSFDEDNITIKISAKVGNRYLTKSPKSEQTQVIAIAENATDIMFDSNHPLAGKTLIFTIFINQIKKADSLNLTYANSH